jgi:peptidoglycan/xylan/chitin deacetylase (PgdA/CDA1 family)
VAGGGGGWSAGASVERIGQLLGPVGSFVPRPRTFRGVVYRARRGVRALALTFDDGPSDWTPDVLDILRDNGARATFFVLGDAIQGREETLRRVVREGHELGNHFHEHRDPRTLGDRDLETQLRRADNEISDATGGAACLVRPPYGRDARRVASVAASLGLGPTVLYTIVPGDWSAQRAAPIVRHVLAAARPGAIVLLHDGVPPSEDASATVSRQPTVDAVAQLVPKLISRGYGLLTVSELLNERVRAG